MGRRAIMVGVDRLEVTHERIGWQELAGEVGLGARIDHPQVVLVQGMVGQLGDDSGGRPFEDLLE